MTLLWVNENRKAKARCDEMPLGDYYIFVYDSDDNIRETKYWDKEKWQILSPAPLMPSEYLTSESWVEVLF